MSRLIALLLLALAPACAPGRIGSAPLADLAIVQVTIVDVQSGALLPDQTVLIAGDRIQAVGSSTGLHVPSGARVVPARGKYLIPGLWDMHAHTDGEPGTREIYFPRWIARGVTGIRDMAGDCFDPCDDTDTRAEHVQQWRRAITEGTLLGPRIVASSALIDGPWPVHAGSVAVSNEAEARRAVEQMKNRGADFLKVYSLLPREAYFALAHDANQQGIRFAGHVPEAVSVEEAVRAGQASMEHLFGIMEACSTRESEIREARQQAASQFETLSEFDRIMLSYGRTAAALESYSEEKCAPHLEVLAAHRSWQVPTLFVLRKPSFFFTEEALRNRLNLVGALHRAGVPILAGTDAGEEEIGSSLHEELALLVEAGLSPVEALRAATRNAAEYLDLADSLGAVQKGAIADLVLLEANPLEHIHNTQRIDAVVLNGRYLDRQALDDLLAKAEAASSQ
jgi:imidazolonepropionase-like amidohydrolase